MTTFVLIILLLLPVLYTEGAIFKRHSNDIYGNDELNHLYARTHEGTVIMTGTLGRYAPQEWPSWYTRTLFKWNGENRLTPYHPNDVRFVAYHSGRI